MMADKNEITKTLDKYRQEIVARSPNSYAIWQKNRTVIAAVVFPLGRCVEKPRL
jgi:hypothetical protein